MSKKVDPRELTAHGRTDVENEMREAVEHVLKQPKIPTMDKKLIIEASTPGHYPQMLWERVGIKNMPPWSIEDQASAIVECVKAGAAGVHSHPRDPSAPYGYEVHAGKNIPELEAEILGRAFREVDFVTLSHAWHPKNWEGMAEADFITPTKELLNIGKGNKYIQGNVMPTWINPWCRQGLLSSWFTANSLREGIVYLEENNVKPLIALHVHNTVWFKNNVIDHGVFKTRPHLNIQDGKHGEDRSFADPASYLSLTSSIELVRKLVPDCTIGLHAGGRNWLPMTILGIMLGVDVVRIGIEDMFWSYPHKNEYIKSPVESVKRVIQIARALGRDIATVAEARQILGIKLTSPKAGGK